MCVVADVFYGIPLIFVELKMIFYADSKKPPLSDKMPDRGVSYESSQSRQSYNHDLRLVSPAGNGSGVGAAGGNHQSSVIHPVVILGKQPLSRGEQSPAADADLPAVAVAGENQVDGVLGQMRIVFRMVAQQHPVVRGCRECFQKGIIKSTRHLSAG